ncbi:hypothetical protein [Pedobacter sp. R-06]|uniref:hypothetical protein n=1 Tax=Pedobacter sp. R-06 TaxID=3404051 RepID=UPI003CEB322D
MDSTEVSRAYFYAQQNLHNQEINLANAKVVLNEFQESGFSLGPERQLRATVLAQKIADEKDLYDEKLEELGDIALELIEEILENGGNIGEEVRFEMGEGRYFKVILEKGNNLTYLGSFSEL